MGNRGFAAARKNRARIMKKWLILIWVGAFSGGVRAGEAPPLSLVGTIALPGTKGRFDHFTIDTRGRRLFAAALGNNSVEVIDLEAGSRTQSVTGMSKPTGVLYLPESGEVLVANGEDGSLKKLGRAPFKTLQTASDLSDADNLRWDPKTKLAWLGYGDGALASIDPSGLKKIASVRLAAHPESFQLERNGSRLFVNLPDAKQIAVVDREQHSVVATWPMTRFQANFPMALDESSRRLFVGCRRPARLVILDIDSGKAVADLAIAGDTDDLFYDAKRGRVYLSCGEGFIDVVARSGPDTCQRIARMPTANGARTSFYSPELDRYYLAVPAKGDREAEIRVYEPR
jgi:hypothetical protein